jgi:hypothetical protein
MPDPSSLNETIEGSRFILSTLRDWGAILKSLLVIPNEREGSRFLAALEMTNKERQRIFPLRYSLQQFRVTVGESESLWLTLS